MNSAYSESYTYDDLNQLQIFARSGGTPTTQGWMMDALGNWTFRVTDSLPEFGTTNAQNELTDIDSVSLAYDANGNMTVDELGRSLTYDAWNRLTVVVDASSTPVAAYQYDALGQRVLRYTDDGTVTELRDLFYSDQWQVLEERIRLIAGGVSSQADVQNVWSPVYVDALIERDRDADASATTGVGGLEERVYALQDANWNTTALVAASVSGVAAGTVLNRFIYSAYGEAEVFDAAWSAVSAPSVPWTQLFQGLSMTALTGLAYVRHRDYSPRLGRFIQRDPLGFEAGDNNWYRFVGNGPTGNVDPSGMEVATSFAVDGYRVTYTINKGDDIMHRVFRRYDYPGPWGQPADRTSGSISWRHGAETTVTLRGGNVCGTIVPNKSILNSNGAGAIRASVRLPAGCYDILWSWEVSGRGNATSGMASVFAGDGTVLMDGKEVVPNFHDGGTETTRLTVLPGQESNNFVIGSFKPAYSRAASMGSDRMPATSSATARITILQIKKK
jgi:RHS repeat-associated protein